MDAAAAAGVSDRTVREWRTTIPAFSDYVAALRHELRDAAVGGLAALATRAVTVIDGLLNSENESIRLSAARVVTGAIPSEQTGVAAGNPVNVQVNVIQDACRGLSPDQLARVQERLRVVTPELNVDD